MLPRLTEYSNVLLSMYYNVYGISTSTTTSL